MAFLSRLKEGLSKTKDALLKKINDLLKKFVKIDEDFLDELEEILICDDVGVETTEEITEKLRDEIRNGRLKDKEEIFGVLKGIVSGLIGEASPLATEPSPVVILVVGVNGAGKTTAVGKMANYLVGQGKSVTVAAADTFRAGAIEQLSVWCERAGAGCVRQHEGSDPAAVVYDAAGYVKKHGSDFLIIDTAGRLHNQKNLMNELGKINRVIDRELPSAARENLLVLDGTTGQNAVAQARCFGEILPITGLILNKLDGTAKGGVVLSIKRELGIPVKFVGVGEKIGDMQPFDRDEFVSALFD